MAAGDTLFLGPYLLNDNDTISGAMKTAGIVVADDLTMVAQEGQVWMGVVKAA